MATTSPYPAGPPGPVLKRVARYRRVSTDEQAEWGTSLADQDQQTAAAILARRGWVDCGADYINDGVSGTLRRRPAMDRLIADCQARKIDVVVITKLDRFARKLKTLLHLWDAIEAAGAAIVIIEESIDSSTAVGRLVRNVLGAIAEFEVENIRARTMAGRRTRAKEGHVWRTRAPLGYRYVKGDRAAGTKHRLELDSAGGGLYPALVEEIITRVGSGEISASALAREFNARGVPTQRGGAQWYHATITGIIHNPAHHGRPEYGRFSYTSHETDDGRIVRAKRRGDDPIAGSGPAIVTEEEVEAARQALARNLKYTHRAATKDYLLGGGLITCGVCGEPHHWAAKTTRHGHPRYWCRVDQSHSLSGRVLEPAVWEALAALLRDPARIIAAARKDQGGRRRGRAGKRADAAEDALRRAERELADLDRRRGELLDLRLERVVDDAVYRAKDAQLAAGRAVVERRRDDLAARVAPALAPDARTVAGVEEQCRRLAAWLDDPTGATAERRRWIVRRVVRRIVATRQEVTIEGRLPGGSALASGVPANVARGEDAEAASGVSLPTPPMLERVLTEAASPKRFHHPLA